MIDKDARRHCTMVLELLRLLGLLSYPTSGLGASPAFTCAPDSHAWPSQSFCVQLTACDVAAGNGRVVCAAAQQGFLPQGAMLYVGLGSFCSLFQLSCRASLNGCMLH